MSPIGFHSPISGTLWEDLRGMAFLEETHHWGWDLRVFIALLHFQFTLSASCLWLRCDLSPFCSSSVPAAGCHVSTMMHSCFFGVIKQNKFLPYVAFDIFFYHGNGKIIITHLFFLAVCKPSISQWQGAPSLWSHRWQSPYQECWGGTWDFLFLTSSQVILRLLAHNAHSETHCYEQALFLNFNLPITVLNITTS